MKKLTYVIISLIMLSSIVIVNADEIDEYSPNFYSINNTYYVKDKTFIIDSDQTLIMLDGDMKTFTGMIKNGTTFVPVRAISELFGKEVLWYPNTREIRIDETILLQIGSNLAKNGDEDIILSYPLFIYDGITYVPLRFIAESFDKEVGFVHADNWGTKASLVWIEDKQVVDNMEYSLLEVKKGLESYTSNNAVVYPVNYDSIKYISQVGRYQLYSSPFPAYVMVDAEKEKCYFYEQQGDFAEMKQLVLNGDIDNNIGIERFELVLDNELGKIQGTISYDNTKEHVDISKVIYKYYDKSNTLKFIADAYNNYEIYENRSFRHSNLSVRDYYGKELLTTNDIILISRYDVVFADMNFDGYVDIITYNGGVVNVSNIIFLWNEESEIFEKAIYEGFDMLSFYEIEDGYLNNFIRGNTPEESYKEKLVWQGNRLIKVMEE